MYGMHPRTPVPRSLLPRSRCCMCVCALCVNASRTAFPPSSSKQLLVKPRAKCVHVCAHVCVCVCMFLCLYVCTYMCMNVDMRVDIFMYTFEYVAHSSLALYRPLHHCGSLWIIVDHCGSLRIIPVKLEFVRRAWASCLPWSAPRLLYARSNVVSLFFLILYACRHAYYVHMHAC